MDFVISENQKKLIKDSAKKKLELEIYSAAIVAGIDPESLELSNGIFTWTPSTTDDSWISQAEKHLRQVLDVYENFFQLAKKI